MTSAAITHRFIRPGQVAPDRPAPDACMQCGQPEANHPAPAAGPFATGRQAWDAALAQYEHSEQGNLQQLTDAANAAGLVLGDYDRRILEWLAGYEPATCAVVAGLITRAAERSVPGQSPPEQADRSPLEQMARMREPRERTPEEAAELRERRARLEEGDAR